MGASSTQRTGAAAWQVIEFDREDRADGESLYTPDQIRDAWHDVGFALIKGIDRGEFEGLSPSVASNAKWLCRYHDQLDELGVFDLTTATHPTRIRQAFNRIKDRAEAEAYPVQGHLAALQALHDAVPDLPLQAFTQLMQVVSALQAELMHAHLAKLKAAGYDTTDLEAELAVD